MARLLSYTIVSLSLLIIIFGTAVQARPQPQILRRQSNDASYTRDEILRIFQPDLSNGLDALPAPPSSLVLRAIALGRGVQNYTCADSTAASKPTANGARAVLYDVIPRLTSGVPKASAQAYLRTLPQALFNDASTLPVLGDHYFSAPGVPTFDLTRDGEGFLLGKKVSEIAAPSSDAVGWLEIEARPGSSRILRAYRVDTVLGKAPVDCAGQKRDVTANYAALYWFYGKAARGVATT